MTELTAAEAAIAEAEDEFRTITKDGEEFRILPRIKSRPLVALQRDDFDTFFKSVFHPDDVERAIDAFDPLEALGLLADLWGRKVGEFKASAGS